ncbi:MAG: type I-MYXAN CRISPR-associated protein Cas6/Cmx6 [bacterium]
MSNLYWSDEEERAIGIEVPEDIVDLSFKIDCRQLPIDHAQSLSTAILKELPWMATEEEAAIHQIHVAASGNGWIRPEDRDNDVLYVSKRTQLTLRIPTERVEAANALIGKTLDIDGEPLTVGKSKSKKLSKMTTLFARYVVGPQDEYDFLNFVASELKSLGITPKKLLCGIQHPIETDKGELNTRSVMLAELELAESILLQRKGLGSHRLFGCGIIIPHKGIEAVKKPSDDPDMT